MRLLPSRPAPASASLPAPPPWSGSSSPQQRATTAVATSPTTATSVSPPFASTVVRPPPPHRVPQYSPLPPPDVRSKIEEDGKPVLAKSLSVHIRCYESRVTRTGSHRSRVLVDYAKTLWQKPDNEDYAPLGDFDSSFKITLPTTVPGFSTANYQEYKTFWRIEASEYPLSSAVTLTLI